MRLAAFGLVLLVACKGEPRSPPSTGSGSGPAAPVVAAPPTDPRLASLPGELWFLEDGPPAMLVRIAAGKRTAIEAPLFPTTERLPDGRLIAISSRGDGSPDSEQLVLVAPDGTQTPIGPTSPQVRDPVADTEGTWIIAAIQFDGRSELQRIHIATGRTTRLTDNKEGNFHPVRLDAGSIAFVSSRDGDSELYRMPVDHGAEQRLTAFHKDDWDPAPSPDGTTIMFTSDREGPPRLCLIAADGTKFRRLTTRADRDVEEVQPQWSRDGTKVAYVIRGGGRSQVVKRSLETGAELIVTPPGASDSEPMWSPDGAWLAVVRQMGGAPRLIALPVSSADPPIAITHGPAQLPRWFAAR